jgi:ribosome-associated protein
MAERLLAVTPALSIPLAEIVIRATPSSGPGGQHVNRSSTRIEAVWSVAFSPALTETQRGRLLLRLASRLDGDGNLRVVASDRRSQLQNRAAALERLAGVVSRALAVPKARRATRPTRASKERRLESKKRRGETKRERRRPHDD